MFRHSSALFLAIAILGCTSSRTALDSSKGASLTHEQALEMMRRVEREPLTAEAPELRSQAFEWIVTADEVGEIAIDTRYLKDLESSWYPFKGEMLMQYAFGMAMWKLTGDSLRDDHVAQAESGLRSVLVAYHNMLAADAKLREPSLETLDDIRRRGQLREYILKIDGARP